MKAIKKLNNSDIFSYVKSISKILLIWVILIKSILLKVENLITKSKSFALCKLHCSQISELIKDEKMTSLVNFYASITRFITWHKT